ncbi:hypothetical protein K2173_020305 [Erythroxylum novogranatense]|uniref:Protein transport protein sec16 n=1 Tax=Erythroxylum novogranatense TaxID=1862640 RepID=A0AAV8U7K5_9ROSI|nr:hypothetical protein K2173_020305 [Erythroxylum novogranatense]
MASSPPVNVMEDQTDEDFFDKLVDDDFGHTHSGTVAPNFAEGSDSDEAKAFANLSIDDNVAAAGFDGKHETAPVQDDLALTNTLDSSNSIASQNAIDSNDDGNRSEDVVSSQSHDPMKSGVKEIEWSSFYADSSGHGFGSYSDFFNGLGDSSGFSGNIDQSGAVKENVIAGGLEKSTSYEQCQGGAQVYGGSMDGNVSEQDVYSNQDWSSMYPGWKYDDKTGQWYQITNFDANFNTSSGNEWAAVSDAKAEVSYLQNTSQSAVGTVAESNTYESVSNWNQVPQDSNNGYPAHMVFDPQYPGWYYDQIVQEWRTLESYTSSVESTNQAYDQQSQNAFHSSGSYSKNGCSIPNNIYGEYGHADKYVSQGYNNQGQQDSWSKPYASYTQQDLNVWQPNTVAKSDAIPNIGAPKQSLNSYVSDVSMSNSVDQHKSFSSMGTVPSYEKGDCEHVDANGFTGSQGFLHGGNFSQQFNQGNLMPNEPTNFSNNYFGSQKQVNLSQQSFQTNQQYSYSPSTGRSSAGRPPHALVTFGFGGKLIVMKNSNPLGSSTFGKQEPAGGSISVLNLVEVVFGNGDNASSIGVDARNYFRALCQQSFPGPLVGGNLGTKELNKWIDERIANCELPEMDHRKGEILRLLLSLLKIACQHYGKLRSSLGTDTSVKESDTPESAVAKLFASAKRSGSQFSEYGVLSHCLQNLPSEGQLRATASEVQSLLVSGRKKEALQCAQEGQLWGPALVLASQLGDQFYVDTVKQMAVHQLVSGSPLRTLCLLIAGTPADVFAVDSIVGSVIPGAVHMTPQSVQLGANGMLDDWEENLAVITANRTKDDELVIIHLGDCLWRDRSEIIAAHICYIVAEANFEPYSDSARLCLLGANHLKHPRTYTSPEAIQRTELYEYSKVLGNSQYILLPFQPYKLVYAYMLAEVGKVSDSLKYCQALLKSLKTGRAAEVETWKQLVSSLEERIRTHQQGGYASNLAPGKLVGKLLNFFDSTAHRVVGGLPPPAPSGLHGSMHSNELYEHAMVPRVSASQSTMAMSSLMPSASMEPISEWAADGNKMTVQNRSVSEPDFSRNPRKVDPSKEGISSTAQGKASGSVGGSRFGRFGFGTQLLQKTVGLVLRPRNDRQAKLGDKNKFYYDEKLKRWVEEGAEPPAEEAALAPPPTTGIFQNGMSDYNLKSALKHDASPSGQGPTLQSSTSSEYTSGTPIPTSSSQTPPIPTSSSQTPPIPTSSNQFSARGRMGVRARYVDTFNKAGGTSTNLFQSPSIASVKPPVATNQKFFVPTPVPSGDNSIESSTEDRQTDDASKENPSKPALDESFPSSTSVSSMTMQRFPSMGNITGRGDDGNASHVYNSRRTASWSGSFNDSLSAPRSSEAKTLGETLGMPPSSFTPTVPPTTHMLINRGNSGDDLHEVEL